ncbi:MAG: hypothetical protein HZY76_07110 [Anaerolineae bacterium]|nr:MAG: hypothetical protein HZY76_07110 [Anaerolineae bacterium]
MSNVLYSTQQASGKFDRLQRQVVIRHILDSLQGKRSDDRLLSYDEVRGSCRHVGKSKTAAADDPTRSDRGQRRPLP